eukprot:357678-Chlamydomonas_euryale.AAC.16
MGRATRRAMRGAMRRAVHRAAQCTVQCAVHRAVKHVVKQGVKMCRAIRCAMRRKMRRTCLKSKAVACWKVWPNTSLWVRNHNGRLRAEDGYFDTELPEAGRNMGTGRKKGEEGVRGKMRG